MKHLSIVSFLYYGGVLCKLGSKIIDFCQLGLFSNLIFSSQANDMRPNYNHVKKPFVESCHELRTPNETFFHWNPELLGLGRQIGWGIWGIFGLTVLAPILVQWVPCPCFPLFHYKKTKPLYPHPKYLFGIGIWIWIWIGATKN